MAILDWKRSSFCGGGGNNCVEIAVTDEDGDVAIRNSARPQTVIRSSRPAFAALITQLRGTAPS
ncbi:DUF397 domain-containing protein [Streptomyces collinus]|uniref:DUF397 domain-containing protein n=1 Tax=Streptomyces collinus TaxID=42684 RepID=UPI00367A7680